MLILLGFHVGLRAMAFEMDLPHMDLLLRPLPLHLEDLL